MRAPSLVWAWLADKWRKSPPMMAWRWLVESRAEAAFTVVLLAGWGLFAQGLHLAFGRWVGGLREIAWGLFLIGLVCGFRVVRTMVMTGLYSLRAGRQ